ncbi:MAG: HNH endonuclease [Rhodospirillales bacterium]|nr:HNH endonuclease [Rhodospirillales bacterium]
MKEFALAEASETEGTLEIKQLEARNQELCGKGHPETGVLFEMEKVRLPNGEVIEGVFPKFEYKFARTLPEELHEATDYRQISYTNDELRNACESDLALREQFTEKQLKMVSDGNTPEGYTWHHSQQPGRMELVDTNTHLKTGHTGGKEIWCGGTSKVES